MSPLRAFVLTVLCAITVAASASAQSRVISGTITDQATHAALPGAAIVVEGTAISTASDREGVFRLSGVPAGPVTLVVNYLGRREMRVEVPAAAELITQAKIEMDGREEPGQTRRFQESVIVQAPLIADAQARALNQQKTALNVTNIVSADQIGSFPDPNAAEATQRIPGVSVQRDMGEGRYVIIRGTEPRLNATLINGERIPAPEADRRQVALDVIPADLLQAIEVSKTFTPDMDGDAIGGSVNLVTKDAPNRLRAFGSIGGGYNRSLESYDQRAMNGTVGWRFMDGRIGAVVSGSSAETHRGTQDFEPVYTNGGLTDLDLRSYLVTRRRNGGTGALDFRVSPNTRLAFHGIYDYYIDDREQRQRLRERVANRRLERELRDRTHTEHIWSASGTGDHTFGRATLDVRLSGAKSDQHDPLTIATTFRQSNVNFSPNVSATSIDPDNVQANPLNENLLAYAFNQQVRATNFAGERDIVGAANLRVAGGTSHGLATFFKVGAQFRDKDKSRTRDEVTLTNPGAAIPLSSVTLGDGSTQTILDNRYTFGPFLALDAAKDLPSRYTLTSTVNHARDSEDFTIGERVGAGYAMVELYTGAKLTILPGVRYEHTSAHYTASEVLFAANGSWLETRPLTGSKSYGTVLPGVNLRYAIAPNDNVRFGVTRSMARPNYIDLVPYRSFNDSDNTIALGNPALDPTRSWNVDALFEHYLPSVGVLSAGVFYKRLEDYIYSFKSTQPVGNETFIVTQALNGESASIRGVEFAAQSQLGFLPSPLDGLGLYANYTFTDSEAVFPGRSGEKATLPGQSRHVGNVAGFFEKAGFSTRLSVNFHGSYIDLVGAQTGLDRFYDTHTQVDFSISQRIARRFRAYLNAINLTDAPLRYYEGVPDRPLQEEHYKTWFEFGGKVDW